MRTPELESKLVKWFDPRRQLIVPNVSWGWGLTYEVDLVVVRPSGYAIEVELKISRADVRKDQEKRKWLPGHDGHHGDRFRESWFAVPEKLQDFALANIPAHCGLIVVPEDSYPCIRVVRKAKLNTKAKPLTEKEEIALLRLAAIRMWTLKHHRAKSINRA